MTAGLLLASLVTFAAGAIVDLVLGVSRRAGRAIPYVLAAVGGALAAAAGIAGLAGRGLHVSLAGLLGLPGATIVVDHLAALFLLATAGVSVFVSLAFGSWALVPGRVRGRGLGAIHNGLLASIVLVLVAGDAFVFLIAWEGVTLCLYGMASFQRHRPAGAGAGFIALSLGKVGGAMLLVGLLLVAAHAGTPLFAAWSGVAPGPGLDAAWLLLVLGFAVKLGAVPFHLWMPEAYPAAPGPARAVMAGVAVNVGVYGMLRILAVLGRPPAWIPIVVLLLGGITAALGVAHAAVHDDLNGTIAYSSVENGGLLLVAVGIALTGAAVGSPQLEAVGALVAVLHTVTHSLAKSLLFLTGATMEAAAGSSDLGALRGIGRRLPWSGLAFGVGAVTLAGLPPTVGFVSEWFLLEALMQQFRLSGLGLKLAMAGAGALVALTAGFAVLVFVRLVGLVVLGGRRDASARREAGPTARAAALALAVGCLGVAAVAPLEIRLVARGLDVVTSGTVAQGALASPWVLQPVFPGFSILSPSWLWIALPLLVAAGAALAWAASRGRAFRVRRVPAWRSAGGDPGDGDGYTPFGYSNPVRHVLSAILQPRRELRRAEEGEEGHVVYSSDVVEAVETFLYTPLRRGMLALSDRARRLQSGKLSAYVGYVLATLVLALVLASVIR